MRHDLIRRVEPLGNPRVLVVGDLILDRYIWGFAERISQEAPVPLLRADQREHRLGGAASVATMLRALGAAGELVGGVGQRPRGRAWCGGCSSTRGSTIAWSCRSTIGPRRSRSAYIGRAQDRHPQQMIRVDYETRDPIPAVVEARLHGELDRGASPGPMSS